MNHLMSEIENSEMEHVLERNIQSFLCRRIAALQPGLSVIASEYPTPSGRIDILARDSEGRMVVIELKRGVVCRDAVGQLQSYMGAVTCMDDFAGSFVRGILVGASLDTGAESAIRVVHDIDFVSYEITFRFAHIVSSPSTYEAWNGPSLRSLGRPCASGNSPIHPLPDEKFCVTCRRSVRAPSPSTSIAGFARFWRDNRCPQCGTRLRSGKRQ